MAMVSPLDPGTRLVDRFEIGSVLGTGGFSIVYDALDLRRGDRAVIKEFVPPDARRNDDGSVDLGTTAVAQRRAFLAEAQALARLTLPGILPIRLGFSANGTGYVATDAVPDARTLDALIRESDGLDPTGVLDLAYQLIETLSAVHDRGLLHRDVKPSNVLVGRDGFAYLLDFGAARAWNADALAAHTVAYTPGYAPPEQMVAVGRRGPATDVYGLCATLYASLTGRPPEDAVARSAGSPLTPLAYLRPDVDAGVASAIEAGLSLRASERPADMAELRRLLDEGPGNDAFESLGSLDDLLFRARRFAFDRRACPACGGVLEGARPLAKDCCPVCRRGRIRVRRLEARACPQCRHGVLRPLGERRGLLSRKAEPGGDWRCDSCDARFETVGPERWRESSTGIEREISEWARIAAGLDPGVGEAFCDACEADYALDDERVALLLASEDPHGFAAAYLGRLLPRDRVRWIAVGKRSPHPGVVCERCHTEFDRDGHEHRLVDSPNRRLDRHAGESRSLESWHRIAEGLPEAGREAEIEALIVRSIATAYRRGEIGFGELAWKGPGVFQGRTTAIVAREDVIRLGRGLRAKSFPVADLRDLRAEDDRLVAEARDGAFEIHIKPIELVAHLRSGDRAVLLTASDLAARLAWKGIAGSYRTD